MSVKLDHIIKAMMIWVLRMGKRGDIKILNDMHFELWGKFTSFLGIPAL